MSSLGILGLQYFLNLHLYSLKRFEDAAAIGSASAGSSRRSNTASPFRHRVKAVAKFHGGIRMGMGFIFSRDGGPRHPGDASSRRQVFEFLPHYRVALRASDTDGTQVRFVLFLAHSLDSRRPVT